MNSTDLVRTTSHITLRGAPYMIVVSTAPSVESFMADVIQTGIGMHLHQICGVSIKMQYFVVKA